VPKSRRWLCTNCRTKEKVGIKSSTRGRSDTKPSPVATTERDTSMGSVERRRSSGRTVALDQSNTSKEVSEEKKVPGRSTRAESSLEKNRGIRQTHGIERSPNTKTPSASNAPQVSEVKTISVGRTIHKKGNISRDITKPVDSTGGPIETKKSQTSPNSKSSTEKGKVNSSDSPKVTAQGINSFDLDPDKSNVKTITTPEIMKGNEAIPLSPPKPVQRSRSGRMVKQSRFHDELHEGEQHLKSGKPQQMVSPSHYESETKKKPIDHEKVPPSEVSLDRNSELPKDHVDSTDGIKDVEVKKVNVVKEPETSAFNSHSSDIKFPLLSENNETDAKTLHEKEVISSLPNQSVSTDSTKTTSISTSQISQLDPSLTVKPDALPTSNVTSPVDSQVKTMDPPLNESQTSSRVPRRKPGARECMQISRKFGAQVIPTKYIQILLVCIHFLPCNICHDTIISDLTHALVILGLLLARKGRTSHSYARKIR
jgi:hypothetical protein